jgi:hypothetical protein
MPQALAGIFVFGAVVCAVVVIGWLLMSAVYVGAASEPVRRSAWPFKWGIIGFAAFCIAFIVLTIVRSAA